MAYFRTAAEDTMSNLYRCRYRNGKIPLKIPDSGSRSEYHLNIIVSSLAQCHLCTEYCDK